MKYIIIIILGLIAYAIYIKQKAKIVSAQTGAGSNAPTLPSTGSETPNQIYKYLPNTPWGGKTSPITGPVRVPSLPNGTPLWRM